MLSERLSDKSTDVVELLSKYLDTPESDFIDSNKYFKKIIDELEKIIEVVFCSNLRINQEKTTIDVLLRIKNYF